MKSSPCVLSRSTSGHAPAWMLLGLFLALAAPLSAQERRAYEGVVSWKKKTLGTIILVDIRADHSVGGWIQLQEFVPIEQGSATDNGVQFTAAGDSYTIDEQKGRITYSGPDGQGDRLVTPLTRLSGRLQEVLEPMGEKGPSAILEVDGRRHSLNYDEPVLWKQNGLPFEKFPRLKELLGKNISVWASDTDEEVRSAEIVVVEEPEGMDIPLKSPQKTRGEEY